MIVMKFGGTSLEDAAGMDRSANIVGQQLSSRFVAGNQVEDAIRVAAELNRRSISVSVDNLGENVTNVEEARASAQLYHQLLDQMAANKLNANVSLKLTHMGLDVDEQLARDGMAYAAGLHLPGPLCYRCGSRGTGRWHGGRWWRETGR